MLWQLTCYVSSCPRIRAHWASINLFQSNESRIVIAWKILWRHWWFPRKMMSEKWVQEFQPIRNITQILVVTFHQHGISAPISKLSFRKETTSCVMNCRLVSQARMISQFYCKKNRTAPLPWTSNSWDWETCLLVCCIVCFVFSFQYWRGVCT